MVCGWLCPLGAFYSLFNCFSFYSLQLDKNKCVSCNACVRACKMDIKVYENPNSGECIRCGECVKACLFNAISNGFKHKEIKDVSLKEHITVKDNM